MEQQQNENKYNVDTDHQTKQNTIPKMRACVNGLYTLVKIQVFCACMFISLSV